VNKPKADSPVQQRDLLLGKFHELVAQKDLKELERVSE
jgi:hypothetical protein